MILQNSFFHLLGRLNFPQLHVSTVFPFQAHNSFAFVLLLLQWLVNSQELAWITHKFIQQS